MTPKDRTHYETTIASLNEQVAKLTAQLSDTRHDNKFLRMTIVALSNPNGMDHNTFALAMKRAVAIAEEESVKRLYFAYDLYKRNFVGTEWHERMTDAAH